MRTWIKGGILVAAMYLLVQLIDDFCYVFWKIIPLEKVRYLLYLDFLGLHDSLVLQCGSWFEACGILYILIIGFIVGVIIGGIVGMFNKEGIRREILKQHRIIQDGKLREALMQKNNVKEERKKKLIEEEERPKEKIKEEEVPDIEIIPIPEKKRKVTTSKKKREKRRNR